jgi:hypothetical protein
MPVKIKLSEIVESMDCQSDEITAYLNRENGKIEVVPDEPTDAIEDGEEQEDANEFLATGGEEACIVREIIQGKNWIPLPSKFDIHDYQIMEDFCLSQKDPTQRDRLLNAIQGRGAFARFKGIVQQLGLLEKWYEFKKTEYSEIAKQWCEQNGVEYE